MKYYQLDFHSNSVLDDTLNVYADNFSIRRASIDELILYVSQYRNTRYEEYPCSLWCWESGKIQGKPILGLTLKDVIDMSTSVDEISSLSDVAKIIGYHVLEQE